MLIINNSDIFSIKSNPENSIFSKRKTPYCQSGQGTCIAWMKSGGSKSSTA